MRKKMAPNSKEFPGADELTQAISKKILVQNLFCCILRPSSYAFGEIVASEIPFS